MIKINEKPRFDAITLGELHIDRMHQTGDMIRAKYALLNEQDRRTMGWSELSGAVLLSPESKKLLSDLVASLEKDASRILFHIDSTNEEKNNEYIPPGLAGSEEDPDQI